MLNFELCPRCSQVHELEPEQMKLMILSVDEESMRCNMCGYSFKLPDSEAVREIARHQRDMRHG